MNNFLANEWRATQTAKRGSGLTKLSIDFATGESHYELLPADDVSPERVFEHRWAMTLFDNAVRRVRKEYEASEKSRLFNALKAHLGGDPEKLPYSEIAAQLSMTEGAVKVAAHRLSHRCRDALRAEIAQTVSEESLIDDELRLLFQAIRK